MTAAPQPAFDVETFGQVFTPGDIVGKMIDLCRNLDRPDWRGLEPSCGDGAFLSRMPGTLGIEIDSAHCPPDALCMDFFDFAPDTGFDTIIGNPPFVRFRDIHAGTRAKLDLSRFDERTNLYAFFIDRCVDLLRPGGELVFINPREFLKGTSTRKLNEKLMREGTITYIEDLGDRRVFSGFAPNCVIWRFEKGNPEHRTDDGRSVEFHDGQISFLAAAYPHRVKDFFDVRVGAVSGADRLFTSGTGPVREFVCSRTIDTGQGRLMIYGDELAAPPPELLRHEAALRARRIKAFGDRNWWHWGRKCPDDGRPRIYVNAKTRRDRPFFLHHSPWFDGSVLGLMIRDPSVSAEDLCEALNRVDWEELGFRSGGRFLFAQRSLENARLPYEFSRFLPAPAIAAE